MNFASMSTPSLQAFPVEILHRILDKLDITTIYISFRYVCKRFFTITDTYNRYELDFELASKTEFELICRNIRPESVRSLILCDSINRPNQMVLFQQLVDIRKFTRLTSAALSYLSAWNLDNILKHIRTCSLTSCLINVQESSFNHFDISTSVSSIIAQPTLRKLYLHTPDQTNERPWPNQCTLKYLIINRCTLNEYCNILQHSPLLKTVVLENCDSLMKNINEISLSRFALLSFEQVTSLTLEKLVLPTMDILELFLSMTPSLIHLQITTESKLFYKFQWEQFIKVKLLCLKKFEFFFGYYQDIDLASIVFPFSTPFWIDKGLFVIGEYIRRLNWLRVYSIPICVSHFYHVPDEDKFWYSTHPLMKNDVATMDNIHTLTTDLATNIAAIVPIKDKELNRHLFRNVTRFEILINDQSYIDSLRYLSSIIDFSNLVAVKFDIISNNRTNFMNSYQRSFNVLPFDRNNHPHNNKCSISFEKICSMIPRHIKHLDVVVNNVDEMITILSQLNHVRTVVFRRASHFPGSLQEIIAWLKNKKTDFTYHFGYNYLSIWLGKTMTHHQPTTTMTPAHKRAKAYHRYDGFS